ncbi:MAG: hypothetical protein KGR48_11050 [Alphaproteobacteria bacterium]|nr:hypothetical protein [Alphaproteobacteria bacterium]MBU6472063.1 hypothetical protein [Alphaproteobacteria bacterium]MDE2073792.1 hypothetical protein [Alphaproteobacteria bacterium]MDE2352894.1 hypothetical protein [Alphaproteobacteria bacterium]
MEYSQPLYILGLQSRSGERGQHRASEEIQAIGVSLPQIAGLNALETGAYAVWGLPQRFPKVIESPNA